MSADVDPKTLANRIEKQKIDLDEVYRGLMYELVSNAPHLITAPLRLLFESGAFDDDTDFQIACLLLPSCNELQAATFESWFPARMVDENFLSAYDDFTTRYAGTIDLTWPTDDVREYLVDLSQISSSHWLASRLLSEDMDLQSAQAYIEKHEDVSAEDLAVCVYKLCKANHPDIRQA